MRGRATQGSLTNFSLPAGFSVLASKVRISVTPPISSVTTSRSPATAVETMRAPFGSVAVMSRGGRGRFPRCGKGGSRRRSEHGRDRQRRGQARDQHHPPHPRKQRGLLGGRFGRNGYRSCKALLWQQGFFKRNGQRLEVTVGGDEGSPRLDRVLAVRCPELSRSRLKALILAGSVTVKGAPIRDPAYHVAAGDTITIDVPEAVAAGAEGRGYRARYRLSRTTTSSSSTSPKGLVVHPAAGHETGTLVNALIAHCGASLSGIGGVRRPGIVHRLDKDTTGLMVVAKNDHAHQSLTAQFADHGRTGPMQRGYMAFVWGVPNRQRGTVDAPIDRHPHAREKMAVREGGREAVTHWEMQEAFNGRDGKPVASLLACQLETGRTHQIRVHLAHIGHPLMGDAVYGPHFKTKAGHLGAQRPGGARPPSAGRPCTPTCWPWNTPEPGKFCTGRRLCRRICFSCKGPCEAAL